MLLLLVSNEVEGFRCPVKNIGNITECQYIRASCNQSYFWIAEKYYCSKYFPSSILTLISSSLLVSLVSILISILGLVVSNYLLFCVTNFTDLLHIERNVLGYIVIPLVNCLPDLINYHVAMSSDSVDLILGQAIGANLVMFTVIIGLISMWTPFSIENKREMVKEYAWLLSLLLLLTYILSDSKITFVECLLMTSVYFLHIFCTLTSAGEAGNELSTHSSSKSVTSEEMDPLLERSDRLLPGFDVEVETGEHAFPRWFDLGSMVDFVIFLFIPVSKNTLVKLNNFEDSVKRHVIRLPFFHFWLVAVTLWLSSTLFLHIKPVVLLALIVPAFLAIELMKQLISETVCDIFVDIASILNSLAIISYVTGLLIQCLKNLGTIWNVSEYAMGLLAFAVVNSINDLIMNILLSVSIGPSLGVKSCLGTSYLLILIGIGFNGLCKIISNSLRYGHLFSQALSVTMNWELIISTVGLNLVVMGTMVYLIAFGWRYDIKLGMTLVSSWILITVVCVVMDIR